MVADWFSFEVYSFVFFLICAVLQFVNYSYTVIISEICLDNGFFDDTTSKSHGSVLITFSSRQNILVPVMKAKIILRTNLIFIGKSNWDMM